MQALKYIILSLVLLPNSAWAQMDAFYRIENLPIPDDAYLEVGGMALDEDGALYVCSRRGEVWKAENPYGKNAAEANFQLFGEGLHEPLGLAVKDGSVYITQRGELTKLTDRDGDGRADRYESVCSWPLSGNYHDYSYGPEFLPNGNMLLTFNLSWIGRGASLVKWRGWMVEVTPEGEMKPYATGMRSPAGYGANDAGEIFYADNQGDWVGSGRVTHVEKGDFVGHPDGLKWAKEPGSPISLSPEMFHDSLGSLYEAAEKIEGLKSPAVWFPHGQMGISTSDVLYDNTDGKFGPFDGQYFVGDQGQSRIMRMQLEKVNGVYQGACFPFVEGFDSGVLRMFYDDNGQMFVGGTNRGWASTGRKPFMIQRLVWTGKTPFEIKEMKAERDGFTLTFTQAVDRRSASNPESYKMQGFTFKYHHNYGSPLENLEPCTINAIDVAADGMSVRLTIDGLRLGYVHEIVAEGLKSKAGRSLVNNTGYYTLNQIPGGGVPMQSKSTDGQNTDASKISKNQTTMPASWTDGPDQSLEIGTEPGMKYNLKQITLKAGSKVKLSFLNTDDMAHNLVIVAQGSADAVSKAALDMGIAGLNAAYIPESDDVLSHTALIEPGTQEAIYFEAPPTTGYYQFVCTVPGHNVSMRGVILVEK
ncbi:MAG: plastocyanin/azurin family copper-binding protein [Bacteroidia bacterium]